MERGRGVVRREEEKEWRGEEEEERVARRGVARREKERVASKEGGERKCKGSKSRRETVNRKVVRLQTRAYTVTCPFLAET